MLKKSILAVVALGAMQLVNAQTIDSVVTKEVKTTDKYVVETNHFKHNWFIGGQVGVQFLFADHSNSFNGDNWKDELSRGALAFDVNFGKWFTPGIGIRLGVAGMNLKGNIAPSHNAGSGSATGHVIEGFISDDNKNESDIQYLRGHADLLFNVTQMVLGYKADRFYSFIPYASLGYAGTLNKPNLDQCNLVYAEVDKDGTQSLTAGFGIINRFRVSKRLDVNLDLNITAVNDRFDAQHGGRTSSGVNGFRARYDGIASATLGVSYNLGKTAWDRSTMTSVRVNENILAGLRDRVGNLELTNDDLRKQLEEALNRPAEPQNLKCGMPLLITFRIDRWRLSNRQRVNLGFLAEAIKANPDVSYEVIGFADKGTGSVRRNVFLAKKRSEVIYDCLVKEFGVSESQLIRESKGGVSNIYYNDPRCSRAVLLKVAE